MPHFPGYQILGVVQIFGINGAIWGVGCGVPEPRLSFFVEPGLRPMMVRKERPQNLRRFFQMCLTHENITAISYFQGAKGYAFEAAY